MADGNVTYTQLDFDRIASISESIADVSRSLGVRQNAIAGSMIEELNEWQNSYATIAKHTVSDIIGSRMSTSDIVYSISKIDAAVASGVLPKDLNKLNHQALADVGIGNVQIRTAVKALEYYFDNPEFATDPLVLKPYENNYSQFVNEIIESEALAVVASGLVVRQAQDWLSSNVTDWQLLPPDVQDGLVVYFYNVGEELITQKRDAAVKETGEYRPDVGGTPITQDHLDNIEKLREALESPRCFPAGTLILDGTGHPVNIEDISVGDFVLSFDPHVDLGRGGMIPRRVVQLFSNETTEWLHLYWREEGEPRELTVTPGHRFLDAHGDFRRIDAILRDAQPQIVLANGSSIDVTARRIAWSEEIARTYEAALPVARAAGDGLAHGMEPRAWRTYNFEVEGLHTYVAGGVRVHNDSQVTIDFAGSLGRTFGTQLG